MKKVYLQPETEIVSILATKMMAASLPGGGNASGELNPGDEGDVKAENSWDNIWDNEE